MAGKRPRSELGAREDWLAPFQAERAAQPALPARSDSTSYPSDSNGYRSSGERPVSGEGDAPGPDGVIPGAPGWDLPGAELGAVDAPVPIEERDARLRFRRTDQVNVRLTTPQFHALARAGELYGLSPTEMARLFINRGARAVLTGR